MMEFKKLLKQMVDVKASDIFIIAGLPFTFEVGGRQTSLDAERLMPKDTERYLLSLYESAERDPAPFLESKNHDDDFSFALPGIGRFRANVFRQRGSFGVVIRVIPFGLPDPVELNIPAEVLQCAKYQKGLVLVTGPAGSGKTTTLACIVDKMNRERGGHIVTMEDPIEYVHSHAGCIITQREIPTDVATYAEGLRSAMREKPNVILLGEMRDRIATEAAVTAAETAQLIFSTLHTIGAAGTIDRIIDVFPASQQRQIRLQLSMVLQAIISQQLVPTTDGRIIPVFEIMTANTAIRNLIREERTHQIDSAIAAASSSGMRTMDQSLFDLWETGTISRETALRHSVHQEALLRRIEIKEDSR